MRSLRRVLCQTSLALTAVAPGAAQQTPSSDEQLAAIVRAGDARFWQAYNACTVDAFRDLLTSNVEFYHDKGGASVGRDSLLSKLRVNLCGPNVWGLRREAVPGTEAIYPLRDGKRIYGAILSGEHVFYVTPPGKPEFLDGRANFTHLWLEEDGVLRMARILSFHHRPAITWKEITLSPERLEALTGKYDAPKSGRMTMARNGNLLVLRSDKMKFDLHPAEPHFFFLKERDVTFEFAPREGTPTKLIVRERGNIVEEISRAP